MEAARELGEEIETLCGGRGQCGKCKVLISEGAFPKYGIVSRRSHVSEWQGTEGHFITPKQREEGYRLACCAMILGDILVYLPEESRAAKQVVSKRARVVPVAHDPAVRRYPLKLPPASAEDPGADLDRVLGGLIPCLGESNPALGTTVTVDSDILKSLPARLRADNWQVTVSVWMGQEIIRVRPGLYSGLYGVAVDIGSTTLVASLVDLRHQLVLATQTAMNPQIRYGEDVISRINYHLKNPLGLEQMGQDVIRALNDLITALLRTTWPDDSNVTDDAWLRLEAEDIEDMTIVGNTVMHHLLLGLEPTYLAKSPFPPVIQRSLNIKARTLGLAICPSAYVHILPIEAAFVGADNVAVLLAEAPHRSEQMQLIIDIGTNGELALGNKHCLVSASCATGPAFEGAEITFGMRAAPGAIERIRIDPQNQEVAFKVVGNEVWSDYAQPGELKTCGICGSGILDLLAELYRTGIILKSGAFAAHQRSVRFRVNADSGQAEYVIAWAPETTIARDITVTQKDVRQIQLAKAAIYAGCKVLMDKVGVTGVDVVKIAGGFGIHIDPKKILIMGMIPDCDPQKIVPVGNAAGTGAIMALMNVEKRAEADWIANWVDHVELSTEPTFKREFFKALQIPHMEDAFPHLKPLVDSKILGAAAGDGG
jgi:uncharacterized 2Fe-2S/4Fe-4S cluster protein (DUF4445 family)